MKRILLLLFAVLMSIVTFACWTEISTSGQCLYNGNTVTVTGLKYSSGDWDNNFEERIEFSHSGNANTWQTVSNTSAYVFADFPGQHIYVRYGAREMTPGMGAPYNQWVNSNPVQINKCGVLSNPITSFMARATTKNAVEVDWTTGIDGLYKFWLERSDNTGANFNIVGSIDAITGQSQYRYHDLLFLGVTVFYRLIAQDLGGTKTTSDIVSVTIPPSDEFRIYPNPTSTGLITVEAPSTGTRFILRLCTMDGNFLFDGIINTGTGTIDLSSSRIANGMYILQFIDPTGRQHWMPQKILKQK